MDRNRLESLLKETQPTSTHLVLYACLHILLTLCLYPAVFLS